MSGASLKSIRRNEEWPSATWRAELEDEAGRYLVLIDLL